MLRRHYANTDPKPQIAEYYGRLQARTGSPATLVGLDGYYRTGRFGAPDEDMAACIRAIPNEEIAQLETLCPRPDGPLTRAQVGLPPAPTEALDISAYLNDFRQRHPDL